MVSALKWISVDTQTAEKLIKSPIVLGLFESGMSLLAKNILKCHLLVT